MKAKPLIAAVLAACTGPMSGCTSWMLSESTLEDMNTAQLRGGLKSAEKHPWWFDNKNAAEIYRTELEKRQALDRAAEREAATSR